MLIIPAIDLKNGKVVRLWKGDFKKATVYESNALKVAQRWKEQGAKRIHIVDLDGAKTGVSVNLEIVKKITKIGVDIQFGGGVRDKKTFNEVVNSGVAYLILGSGVKDKDFFDWAIKNYRERIIVSVDVRRQNIYGQGWQKKSELKTEDVGNFLKDAGIKKVIWTNIERDGTLQGVDIGSLKKTLQMINIPLIVAGGVSSLEDIRKLKQLGSPSLEGAIIGRAIYEGKINLREAMRVANFQAPIFKHQ